jgi:hypothetical protein
MPLKFFHISSRDSAPMEAELNPDSEVKRGIVWR